MECASFNSDSSMVAIGDMSGVIKVFNILTKSEVWSTETGDLQVKAAPF